MPNKVYQAIEAAIVWQDSGGDETFATNGLADGGRVAGALHDFGASSRAAIFEWRAVVQAGATTTLALGQVVDVYWRSSDGTDPDSDDVGTDDKLRNLHHIGQIQCDEVATSIDFVKSGWLYIPWRHGGPVFKNRFTEALVATNNVNIFTLRPVPPEVQ